ncbi:MULTISPECIES: TnsA-like heteromeric transposase endonuclease subunit [Aeromicrobium]|uniref:TnsA-like heteromeric transposase endonuclease subunit n=1 Tax=Aeromicrobium TaxID=2040 RepID=UPI00257D86CC|nr:MULTISPECIES: TnsA-like heteromeric transposase endonuclease subunit [Aeromicrobium]
MPVRGPRSTAASRHVPVRAHSVTTGAEVLLESGLEHDLLRELDRLECVNWIVAQPLRLLFERGAGMHRGHAVRRHVPDLLTVTSDGSVTVWDARPPERQDERFLESVQRTRTACEERGWRHRVFAGHSAVKRANLMWLHGFRNPEPWHLVIRMEMARAAGAQFFQLRQLPDVADRQLIVATLWHLVWCGDVQVDLERPLTTETAFQFKV